MRILFIHEVNYLTKPIFEMHEFPEHLAARGHDVSFLHFPEGYRRNKSPKLGWSFLVEGRSISGCEIKVFSPRVKFGGILDRLIAASTAHFIVRKAIAEFQPDVVVTLAVPTYGWQAVRVANKLNLPIVYRALDVSHLIRKSVWGQLIRIAESFVAKRASVVSANNLAMAQYIQKLGCLPSRIRVHYPPLELEAFQRGNRDNGRSSIGLGSDAFVIMYMGSFFYFSGLLEVIREFGNQINQSTAILVLVGGGEGEPDLRRLVNELSLEERVIFTGYVDYSDLPNFLSAADVLINPMRRSLVSDVALPNKVIQYLMVGSRVVSTDLAGLRMTFEGFENLSWSDSPQECMEIALGFQNSGKVKRSISNDLRLKKVFGEKAVTDFEKFLQDLSGKR